MLIPQRPGLPFQSQFRFFPSSTPVPYARPLPCCAHPLNIASEGRNAPGTRRCSATTEDVSPDNETVAHYPHPREKCLVASERAWVWKHATVFSTYLKLLFFLVLCRSLSIPASSPKPYHTNPPPARRYIAFRTSRQSTPLGQRREQQRQRQPSPNLSSKRSTSMIPPSSSTFVGPRLT